VQLNQMTPKAAQGEDMVQANPFTKMFWLEQTPLVHNNSQIRAFDQTAVDRFLVMPSTMCAATTGAPQMHDPTSPTKKGM